MWKYLITSSVLICFAIKINAQEQLFSRFQVGIEIGPNISILYGKSNRPYHYIPTVGFSGGMTFQAKIIKHLSIKTSLLFVRKVEKVKEDVYYSDETITTWVVGKAHSNFDYLNLPLLVQFDFGKTVNFFVNAGPYLGLLVHSKSIVEIPNNTVYKFTPKANKVDFGITSGLGIGFTIKEYFTLKIEVRDNLGLLPLYPKFKELKINSIDILFGCTFGIP